MEKLAAIFEEADEIFHYEDGESPSRRAYDYLSKHDVVKRYDETAMQIAVKHLICRAWEGGRKGVDPERAERVSAVLDELIEAVDAMLPGQATDDE